MKKRVAIFESAAGNGIRMKILNIGSINIDHVYSVPYFVRPGETLNSLDYRIFSGGKGFNQSTALARAGAVVSHAGRVGTDAEWLLAQLQKEGIDTTYITTCDTVTGHAIIQVAPSGENEILLYGGANQCVAASDIETALLSCSPGDYVLLQNEISSVSQAIQMASRKKLRIVFNPAPMTNDVLNFPLEMVDLFIMNETEARGITGMGDIEDIRRRMLDMYPNSATVLTLGEKGAIYFDADSMYQEDALLVDAVDTTGAGDTFIGYFLAEMMSGKDPDRAMKTGCRAAEISVTRAGAADSIPEKKELRCL